MDHRSSHVPVRFVRAGDPLAFGTFSAATPVCEPGCPTGGLSRVCVSHCLPVAATLHSVSSSSLRCQMKSCSIAIGVVVVVVAVGECPSSPQHICAGLLRGVRAFERAVSIDRALSCGCMLHAVCLLRCCRASSSRRALLPTQLCAPNNVP